LSLLCTWAGFGTGLGDCVVVCGRWSIRNMAALGFRPGDTLHAIRLFRLLTDTVRHKGDVVDKNVSLPDGPFIGWMCANCGRKLPKGGVGSVWEWRRFKYLSKARDNKAVSSGYYCDSCADARENGADF
jgi:hypothetical protein